MKLYTALCTVVLALLSILLFTRKEIGVTVMRTPGQLYQDRGPDSISNLYNIKLSNKTMKDIQMEIKVEDGSGKIEIVGKPYIDVVKEGQGSGSFFIVLPKTAIKERRTEVHLGLYEEGKKILEVETSFLGYTE